MIDTRPFNPLDKKTLGASVAEAMLERTAYPLEEIVLNRFEGAGIYAIYYSGNFEPYQSIANRNREDKFEAPIYVGKAVPPGARKGKVGLGENAGIALWKRIKEHSESVNSASNLDQSDFHCRFLIVDDIWIPLAESLLIAKLNPLWNILVDGFGNHDPGSGRYEGLRPRWDVLHPGREWAEKCKPRPETYEQIASEVQALLTSAPASPIKPDLLGD